MFTFMFKNIMLKQTLALVLLLSLSISGCSTTQNLTTTDSDNKSPQGQDNSEHNFLSDILKKLQGEDKDDDLEGNLAIDADPVIKSTQEVLESKTQNVPPTTSMPIENEKESESSPIVFNNVWQRIPAMYQLATFDNNRIDQQEKWFLKHKKHINTISQRAKPYLYFITEEVNKRNMPGEIALLPIIESSFNPYAYSRMKASGLWQFVPATGKHFGLKQNWWYDGRRDIYLSTLAALTYLEQLNKYYEGDWLLSLAAYNAGSGTVNRAIKKNLKQGKAIDYWSLPLPKETKKYVPKLLAIARIIKNHQQHEISLAEIKNQPTLTLVNTQSQIQLSVAAKLLGISLDKIRAYNPAFKQWATDPNGPHHLMVPIEQSLQFTTKLASLDPQKRVQWQRHKIRSGESLSVIARHYRVSIKALKSANNLTSYRIRAGKYLMIPSGDGHINQSYVSHVQQKKKYTHSKQSKRIYTVRKGDSFWKIARKFNISHKTLAALNHLSSGDTLSIGQKLIINHTNNSHLVQSISKNSVQTIHYEVISGDSLYSISKQFNVSVTELKRWNHSSLKKYLKPGQVLKVLINNKPS